MIEKFIAIKNLGRFRDCHQEKDQEIKLDKFTIIYSGNGMGKTTLCSIFHSLKKGDPIAILQRKSMNGKNNPYIKLIINCEEYIFEDNKWNRDFKDIEIFDTKFVNDNVFTGDEVTNEHGENLLNYALGEEAVKISKSIERNKIEIKEASLEINSLEDSLKTNIKSGIALSKYYLLPNDQNVDFLIKEKQIELNLFEDKELVRTKETFKKLDLINFKFEFEDYIALLEKEFNDFSSSCETVFMEHVTKHKMIKNGDSWIYQGLQYDIDKTCPFCGQDIQSRDLFNIYRNIFSEEYKSYKESINIANDKITNILENYNKLQVEYYKNCALIEFWSKHIKVDITEIDLTKLEKLLISIKDRFLTLFSQKMNKPLEKIVICNDLKESISIFNTLAESIKEYDVSINKANSRIDQKRKTIEKMTREELINSINALIDIKSRHSELTLSIVEKIISLKDRKSLLEKEKDKFILELEAKMSSITNYGASINKYLDYFSAEFEIHDFKRNNLTNKQCINYYLKLKNCEPFNPRITNKNDLLSPRLSTTLSEGDKSALALAFFLAKVDNDPLTKSKIIIIDDPITSFDSNRRLQTNIIISKLKELSHQLVILSHDIIFIREICPKKRDNLSILKIVGNKDSKIGIFETTELFKNINDIDRNILEDFCKVDKPTMELTIKTCRSIRPALEEYYHNKYRELKGKTLIEMINHFRNDITRLDINSHYFSENQKIPELELLNKFTSEITMHPPKDESSSLEYLARPIIFIEKTLRIIS